MKTINEYILTEHLLKTRTDWNGKTTTQHLHHPKSQHKLREIVKQLLHDGETNLNCIDTSLITDMSGVFVAITPDDGIGYIDISEWDTSRVTDMNYCFYGCNTLECDPSGWDVSSVTNMSHMFTNCSKFDADLSGWNTGAVRTMAFMFDGCIKLSCDLSGWDVSSAKYTVNMFRNCDTLKKLKLIPDWYELQQR